MFPASPERSALSLRCRSRSRLTASPWRNFRSRAPLLSSSVLCAIRASTRGAAILGQKDPQIIVVDEIVGFLVGNFLAPLRWTVLFWSFLLFRFFDITKLFPINRLEQLPGGAGIVLDDVMAGCYTFFSLRLLLYFGWV